MEGFYVGSIVIDVNDRIGYIKKICNCEKCNERGWFEPEICWIDNPNEYDFISDIEYKNGISKRFKRIGKHTFGKEKSNVVKEIEKIEIIRPKDFTREDKYHDQDYLDKWGNLMKKVYDEHKIIISGKTESNDDFSIEIAANGKEVGIKYNLPE